MNRKRDEVSLLEEKLDIQITVLGDQNLLPGQVTIETEDLETKG
jgi:flagellar biosynthesis/type III secretory pathway protein FliH